ncbi:MAG: glycosyltransferase [Ruminococcaceae bacterium]|nr:glycosyltransferase [Oscillospiraceae bacterium]
MISAIITTHKREKEIVLRAVKSVLNQTVSDLELIVVDDSPSDFSGREQVAKSIMDLNDKRITYIVHDEPKGACAARNTGLELAKGEYVAFLDDDDEWIETKLEKQVSVFANGGDDLALVYCQFIYCYDDSGKEEIPVEHFKKFNKGNIYDTLILYNYVASTSFPLIKTECLKAIGGFDNEMLSSQDYDVWLRLAQKYEFDYVPEVLVRYHIHSSESIGKNPQKRIKGQERLFLKNSEYLENNKLAAWHRLYPLCTMYADNKETKKAIKCLWQMIKNQPQKIVRNFEVFAKVIKHIL